MAQPNQQQETIQEYKNRSSFALDETSAQLKKIKILAEANIDPKVKANPTRKAVKRVIQYQDKRLLKAWQADARKAFKRGMWVHRKGKEGKQLYLKSELEVDNVTTNLVQINKDAAKAWLLMKAVHPILIAMEALNSMYWSSGGFSKLMGYKKRKRSKRRYKRYQRKARKSFRRMRKHRGRRLRYRMKRRRGGRKSYRRRRTTRRRSYRRRH